jgi:hypothetical protein
MSLASSPGRYDRFFSPEELAGVRVVPWDDLTIEMEILRAAAERFVDALCRASPAGQPRLTSADLRALGTAFGILSDLAAFQLANHAPLDEFQAETDESLRLTRIEKGLLPPDDPPPSSPPPDAGGPLQALDAPAPAALPRCSSEVPPPPLLSPPSAASRNPPVVGPFGTYPPIRSP